jgi:hypothetical protein
VRSLDRLTAAGREISLASLTDLLRVTRVWWPYTAPGPALSGAEGYPPYWTRYETWGEGPAATLYLDTASEPQSGDAVRIWHERLCTINGLDGAGATTLPADAETLLVTGAVGYIAEKHIMEKPGWRVPRDLKEWATARLQDFHRALKAHARRQATQHAGTGPLPALDRWDQSDDATW